MAKIKYDVSGTEFGASQDFEQPKPGVYTAVIKEIEHGFSKGENSKPDRSRPRLRIVYGDLHPVDDADDTTNYSRVYEYISLNPESEWKMAQFLEAVGIATPKKRKGTLDTDKIVDEMIKLRIKAGANQDGDYRGEVGGVFMYDGDEDGDSEYEEEEGAEEEGEEPEAEEEEGEEDDLDQLGTDADAEDEDAAARLTELAEEAELDPDDYETWSALAEALGEVEAEEEGGEGEGTDDEEEEGEGEEGDDDETYEDWSLSDLRTEAKGRDLSSKGSKADLIERLEENDEADEEEGPEEEEPEDEEGEGEDEETYDDWSLEDLREEAKARGLKTSGSKKALVTRLEENDEEEGDDEEAPWGE